MAPQVLDDNLMSEVRMREGFKDCQQLPFGNDLTPSVGFFFFCVAVSASLFEGSFSGIECLLEFQLA